MHWFHPKMRHYLITNICLNESKRECIVFAPSQLSSDTASPVVPGLDVLSSHLNHVVRSLGVTFDSSLKLDKQMNFNVMASLCQLRLFAKVKPFLSGDELQKAIHAFISSRLNYYNALYFALNQTLLLRLRLIQNAAARLLTSTRKHIHITSVLLLCTGFQLNTESILVQD